MSKLFDEIFSRIGDNKELRNHLTAFLRKARSYPDVVEEEKEYENHMGTSKEKEHENHIEVPKEICGNHRYGPWNQWVRKTTECGPAPKKEYPGQWSKKTKDEKVKEPELKPKKEKTLYEEAQDDWIAEYNVKDGKMARVVRKMTKAEKDMFKETFKEMEEDFAKTMNEMEKEYKELMEGFITNISPRGVKIAGSKHRWPFTMLHIF